MATLVRALACLDLGDQFAQSGDRERALSYYGRALNDYLSDGLFGMAAAVAQRMIERYPDVVRARMTLGVISLAEGVRVLSATGLRNTCADLEDYVRAVQHAGQEDLAARQLRRFAEVTESPAVRERVAALLHRLGDAEGAEVILRMEGGLDGGAQSAEQIADDQHARWIEILLSPPPQN